MNAEQSIKRQVLMSMLTKEQMADEEHNLDFSTGKGIDAAYEQAEEYSGPFEEIEIIDAINGFRWSGQETGLTCKEYSRNYESEQVATKLNDGTYVSWVFWSGGGKHGQPEEIDWIEDAVFVDCEEKQQMVTTYTFAFQ